MAPGPLKPGLLSLQTFVIGRLYIMAWTSTDIANFTAIPEPNHRVNMGKTDLQQRDGIIYCTVKLQAHCVATRGQI
jgi:hypothetical protein